MPSPLDNLWKQQPSGKNSGFPLVSPRMNCSRLNFNAIGIIAIGHHPHPAGAGSERSVFLRCPPCPRRSTLPAGWISENACSHPILDLWECMLPLITPHPGSLRMHAPTQSWISGNACSLSSHPILDRVLTRGLPTCAHAHDGRLRHCHCHLQPREGPQSTGPGIRGGGRDSLCDWCPCRPGLGWIPHHLREPSGPEPIRTDTSYTYASSPAPRPTQGNHYEGRDRFCECLPRVLGTRRGSPRSPYFFAAV